ncbi:MAG TPA: MotA/TolQ/ExbB proton channel family protein [Solirubrobacterales bacterium]|nr:MotA/TolQ/ExbB proton channel family protein [Solirubrobacterales bacterium]
MPPVADIENVLFHIAEALRVPVLVAALLCLAIVLVEFGRFLVELARRRRRTYTGLRLATEEALVALRTGRNYDAAAASLEQISAGPAMSEALGRILAQFGQPDREEEGAKALADFDFGSMRALERTRALVRLGPALGLMGTLIPLSPALAGLAEGDVKQLSDNLRVAFSVTVLGLLIGAVAFVISLVRDRLYGQDLSDLEFVAGRILGPPR